MFNVTLGDVIDPTKIIEKPLLSPKLSPSDNSIIGVPSNLSYIQFTFRKILEMNQQGNNFIIFGFKKFNSKRKLLN